MQTKRIYMNEADASPGNGAAAASPVTAEPTAVPTAPAFDAEALITRFASVVDERIAASEARTKNATFAELRKGGHLKQDKPSDSTPPSQPTPSAPVAAQAGLSMADVEALLERKGVVSSRAAKHGLTEAQVRRLEAAMSSVPRGSLASEADSFLSDLGLVKVAASPTAPVQTPALVAPAKPNISDRGTAAPTDLRDSEGVLNSRPLEMTGHDVDALILKHGHDKGMQMFQERVLSALGKVRIKPPRG